MATINNDTSQAPDEPEAGAGKGWPAPAPMGMSQGMSQGMSGMAPNTGMGYHGYQLPPGFAFPPQQMMPFPGAGGGMPMMAPPQPYAYAAPPMTAPPQKKAEATQICTVHPPGMPRTFDVPFPEKRLPVCDRCKKNYRSRELCRQRDGHKALPWQTTYVVVTLTDEVLVKGEDGNLIYADIPLVAMLQDMPELCRGPADGSMGMEPICPVCKEKNYTRDHCRNTLKHTTPPYQSIYVKLVVKPPGDDDDKYRPAKKKKRKPEENADGKPRPVLDNPDGDVKEEDKSDDLTMIHKSKTFFATISSKKITVKWCEHIQYPEQAQKATQPAPAGFMMPPNMPNNPNMQYQLWDAFRAGAQWAQSGGGQMPAGYQNHMPSSQMPPGQMPPGYGHDSKHASNPNVNAKSSMV
mmetsp:Transcript_37068/g.66746  ORF Transcript_37068/g.66746 Transcript_37068/m.66746 type:complete len:407 (-) Transcript_37068:188-1408(-)